MPGPNSAPNGDRSLVTGITWYDDNGRALFPPVRTREWLRRKGRLNTGKTQRATRAR